MSKFFVSKYVKRDNSSFPIFCFFCLIDLYALVTKAKAYNVIDKTYMQVILFIFNCKFWNIICKKAFLFGQKRLFMTK